MIPAMLASFASFGVMVSVMNLTGYVVVEKHGHAQHDVFPIIGAHVLGMYALVLVIGALIDRAGRTPPLASGLLVMGVAALSLGWTESVPATALLLFVLGIGGTSRMSRRRRSSPTPPCRRSVGASSGSTISRPRCSPRRSRSSAA